MNDELELFKKDFNEEELKKFLIEKFLPEDFQKNEQKLNISQYKFEKIKKVKYIGSSQNPEIHFYIIEHSGIQDPRVTITRETFKIIRDYRHKNSIVLYYTQNSANYRLSLLTIDIVPKTETRVGEVFSNPRRFSYFLGPDSKVKTPTQQIILKGRIKDLEDLKERFSLEVVTKQFYNELQNWYYWAIDKVHFPENNDIKENPKNSTNLIRLITRLMFVWFLKEKKLVPEHLFNEEDLKNIVKDFYKNKSAANYYNAILQNLFFATLNRPINERKFAKDKGYPKNKDNYGIRNLYRYENMFLIPEEKVIELFSSIPFVNGGLFDCLDDEMDIKSSAIDGFTRNEKYRAKIPDYLFFQKEEQEVDLSKYLEKAKKAKVRGLIEILKTYHFTTDENTSIDQDISLDPEMLGKVFENLLAAYNPETSETARKSSGSYYTPREIVDYMVDESLVNYIKTKLPDISEERIRKLFSYTEEKVEFSDKEKNDLIEVIDNIKIIDPACGSGAFPMGILHKLVLALEKIDPNNKLWQERQYKKILEHYKEIEKSKDSDKEEVLKELNETFDETLNNPNYARKLYLIENSIYGVDIQPIAVQISKLRFFISLLIEQKTNSDREKNYGIRPLPNLETKFVVANTLIGLPNTNILYSVEVENLKNELLKLRNRYFTIKSRKEKIKIQEKDKEIREKMLKELRKSGFPTSIAEKIAKFDIFNQNISNDWFDTEWMFGIKDGFDIVIGNPPYGANYSKEEKKYFLETYITTKTIKGKLKGSLDTYTLFIEKGFNLLKKEGNLIFIVPISITASDSVEGLHNFLEKNCKIIKISSYAVRPQPIFQNSVVNTSILFFIKTLTNVEKVFCTKMYRKAENTSILNILNNLEFIDVKEFKLKGRYPKISYQIEKEILQKIFNTDTSIGELIKEKGEKVYYRFAGGRYFKVITPYSTNSSAEKFIIVDKNLVNIIGAILSSNLFFWFYQVYSDNLNLKLYEITSFRLPYKKICENHLLIEEIEKIYKDYLKDIERNALIRNTTQYRNIKKFKEYKISKSKHIIDKLDDIICPLYGMDEKELNFIKNYELNFRLREELEEISSNGKI